MLSRKVVISIVTSFGLLFAVPSNTAAQMTHETHTATSEFQQIEQPLWVKGAVTVGGLGLIGLEVWWFLFSQAKSQKVDTFRGIVEVKAVRKSNDDLV
jgi:plastocyanin domain-containing protein